MKRFFALLIFPLLAFTPHKFYVSNTLMELNPATNTLQITVKIFTDDLDLALTTDKKNQIRLADKSVESDKLVSEYLEQKLRIKLDNVQAEFRYVGKEAEYDLLYCYLEIPDFSNFKKIEIQNTILFELFDEQKNIVDITIGDWKQTLFFTREHSSEVLFK